MKQDITMRTVAISVRNNKTLELFVEKRGNGFEVWVVGLVQKQRTLLDHRLTHDDLERRLEYAKVGDLIWRDAGEAEIPAEKHRNAIEAEATIKRGTFWDYDDPQLDEMEALARQASALPASSVPSHRSVANHLNSIALLSENKAEWNAAKQAILGQWTDGVVTMKLEPDHRLLWSCADRQHPLNVGERVNAHAPNWWNFAMWRLHLMNNEYKCGTHVGVLNVGDNELHVFENGHPHRIAHVFERIGRLEGTGVQKPKRVGVLKKAGCVTGAATPMLRRLEEAMMGRSPLLADRLKPGLAESEIRQALNRANLAGAIEPVIELYSWRNGTALDESTPMEEASFFPKDIYQFMDLETAIERWKSMYQAGAQLREMVQGTEASGMFDETTSQLFPLFSD